MRAGRRWFFTGAQVLATVGVIVAARAQTIDQLIGATVLIGLSSAPQISLNYVLGEIVPVKRRFFVNSMIFLIAFPITGMGPYFQRLFIVHTAAGWRRCYHFSIIVSQYH
jgi:MFS family permease